MTTTPTFIVPPEQLAEWIRADANEVPSPQAWRRLLLELRVAHELAVQGEQYKSLPDGMTEISRNLGALFEFMMAHPVIQRDFLAVPLGRLAHAIVDLSNELRPALITPKPQGKGGLQKRSVEANIEAYAARALDELMKPGPDKMSAEQASRLVAHTITSAKLPGYKKCTPTTVKKWRERILAQLRGKDNKVPRLVLDAWHAQLPQQAGDTPKSRAQFLLYYLRTSPALRWE